MAEINSTPSLELINKLFEYKDGKLIRKITTASNAIAATEAGNFDVSQGYWRVYIEGKKYKVHRVIFFMHHGFWPKFVDHIDNNPKNNKIENLREATISQNLQNKPKPTRNTSGYKNVYFNKNLKKWFVTFKLEKKLNYFGYFDKKEDAIKKSIEVREQLHGEFANHN